MMFSPSVANMSVRARLIQAVCILQETFVEYAGKSGDKTSMTQADFASMLRKECCIEVREREREKD